MSDSWAAFGCTNRRSTTSLQLYCIPIAKRYPGKRIKWVKERKLMDWEKKITHEYVVLILQLVSHRSFQKHEFFLQFILSANKRFVWKVSVMAQVIKKIYFPFRGKIERFTSYWLLSKFKFTKIQAQRTQESLKRYERAQKRQRRPNVTTSKIFKAPYISNDSRVKLEWHNNKGTGIARLFSLFYNLQKLHFLLFFVIYF